MEYNSFGFLISSLAKNKLCLNKEYLDELLNQDYMTAPANEALILILGSELEIDKKFFLNFLVKNASDYEASLSLLNVLEAIKSKNIKDADYYVREIFADKNKMVRNNLIRLFQNERITKELFDFVSNQDNEYVQKRIVDIADPLIDEKYIKSIMKKRVVTQVEIDCLLKNIAVDELENFEKLAAEYINNPNLSNLSRLNENQERLNKIIRLGINIPLASTNVTASTGRKDEIKRKKKSRHFFKRNQS